MLKKPEFLTALCRFLLTTISSWQSTRKDDQIDPAKTGQSKRFFHSLHKHCRRALLSK
jgi:hypothetical protein